MSKHAAPDPRETLRAELNPPAHEVQARYFGAAIDRLQQRRAQGGHPTDWVVQATTTEDDGYLPALRAHVAPLPWSGYVDPGVAALLLTLYATIDAQIAVLEEAIRHVDPLSGFLYTQEDPEYKLAYSILKESA